MASNRPVPAPQLRAQMEVMIVDDEPRIRTMLSQAVRDMGFRPTTFATAEEARDALTSIAFDVLILDLNLPGAGGLDFLSSIRAQHPGIQAIVLTGYGDLDAARRAIHLDVSEFLTKPCSLGCLEAALARARERRRAHLLGTPAQIVDLESADETPLPQSVSEPTESTSADDADADADASIEDLERRHILRVLAKHDGNRAQTAAELGISLRKLYYRIGEYQKRGFLNE